MGNGCMQGAHAVKHEGPYLSPEESGEASGRRGLLWWEMKVELLSFSSRLWRSFQAEGIVMQSNSGSCN